MVLQRVDHILSITLLCAETTAAGDPVEINADLTCGKVDSAGSTAYIGTCVKTEAAGGSVYYASVETKFRVRRDDRLSGAAIAVGPFVWDANGKAIAYSSATHDPAAIAGCCIKSAGAGDVAIETLEY